MYKHSFILFHYLAHFIFYFTYYFALFFLKKKAEIDVRIRWPKKKKTSTELLMFLTSERKSMRDSDVISRYLPLHLTSLHHFIVYNAWKTPQRLLSVPFFPPIITCEDTKSYKFSALFTLSNLGESERERGRERKKKKTNKSSDKVNNKQFYRKLLSSFLW